MSSRKFSSTFENDVELRELVQQLNQHKIYASIRNLHDLRIFMSNHVYAVWDFMSLVKRAQALVVPTQVPWMPPESGYAAARSINEMVLSEESDYDPFKKRYVSHFELYLDAMREIQCSDWSVESFLDKVRVYGAVKALALVQSNPGTRFVQKTMDIASTGSACEVIAWLTWGREKVIPQMFQNLINQIGINQTQAPYFYHYVRRHIELDGNEHSELAMQLLEAACKNDEKAWSFAVSAAKESIRARITFWDETHQELLESVEMPTAQTYVASLDRIG